MMAPLLRRGYTIFAIYHISQPEATVMEIIEDMHRGVRFVRHHAASMESIRSASGFRAEVPGDI